jgi:transcriptional regulator with XRE-family HTH domain
VRRLRKKRELTQEQLAEAIDLHVTYVSQVERGLRNVTLYNVHRFAFALEVSASNLLREAEHAGS